MRTESANRRRLLADLKRDQATRHRATIARMRREERDAKVARRSALERAREFCTVNAQEAREIADRAYAKAKELALVARRATKAAAAEGCTLAKQHVRDEADHRIAHVKREREETQRFRAELARLERGDRERNRARSTAGERRAESNQAVEVNLDPSLVPLWRRVRKSIKGTPRKSRTEAFLHYVEEHPDELAGSREDVSDREFAEEQAAHYARQQRAS